MGISPMKTTILKHKGYIGSIEHDLDEGILYGKVLHVTDLILFEGETLSELKKNFEQAVDDYLADCKEMGIEPNASASGTLNVRLGPELHRAAQIQASLNGSKLNAFIVTCVKNEINGRELTHKHVHDHTHTLKPYEEKENRVIQFSNPSESRFKVNSGC